MINCCQDIPVPLSFPVYVLQEQRPSSGPHFGVGIGG